MECGKRGTRKLERSSQVILITSFLPTDQARLRKLWRVSLAIPLSLRRPNDAQVWGYTKGWSVLNEVGILAREGWTMEGDMLYHFLWRACSGSLATRGRLIEHHIIEDGTCPICQKGIESVHHALIACTGLKELWDNSPFKLHLLDAPVGSFKECFAWLAGRIDKGEMLNFATLTLAAWAYKNAWVFREKWNSLATGVIGFKKLVVDYQKYADRVFRRANTNPCSSLSRWQPPVEGHIKGGMYYRAWSESGEVLAVAVQRQRGAWKACLAEALAARWGVMVAKRLGYSKITLEGDALTVIQKIRVCMRSRTMEELIFEDIREIGSSMESFNCNHVKRSGNTVAHFAARLMPS
ncbi:Phycocyanobilin:ferredoxin oxidoreductase [Bienertia sinuspersici]